MVLGIGLVKFHCPGLQIVRAAHGTHGDDLLLGHLFRFLFGQQGNSAVIGLPVLNDRHDTAILQLSEPAHIAAVDIAVQPVKQFFLLLLFQIVCVDFHTVMYQEVIFRTPEKAIVAAGKIFITVSQPGAFKVNFTQSICTVVPVVTAVSQIYLAIRAVAHGVNPHIGALQFHGTFADAFRVKQPHNAVSGKIYPAFPIHHKTVRIRTLEQVCNILGEDLLSLGIKFCEMLPGLAVIFRIGIHNGIETAIFQKSPPVQTLVSHILGPGDGSLC